MTATVLPADGMIAVLSDAIASKRDTIALMERTAKDAQADLQHLREERAVRLARAAGFEVGQVWVTNIYNRSVRPGIVFDIRPSHGGDAGLSDWRLEFLFEPDNRYSSGIDTVDCINVPYSCLGRVDSGSILEKFATLARAMREQKERAA